MPDKKRSYESIFKENGMSDKEVEIISKSLEKGSIPRHILNEVLENEVIENDGYFVGAVSESLKQSGIEAIAVMGDALKYARETKGKVPEKMLVSPGYTDSVARIFAEYFKIKQRQGKWKENF